MWISECPGTSNEDRSNHVTRPSECQNCAGGDSGGFCALGEPGKEGARKKDQPLSPSLSDLLLAALLGHT